VPVIELAHLSVAQKRALVIADNRLALDAGWDEEMLALELADLSEAGYDLALTGFEDAEIEALLAGDVPTPILIPRRNQTLTSRTLRTMCRMHPSWRCPAPAMSGPSASTV
jgi:ParB-like chromosome segregation protein Spo0J